MSRHIQKEMQSKYRLAERTERQDCLLRVHPFVLFICSILSSCKILKKDIVPIVPVQGLCSYLLKYSQVLISDFYSDLKC